jgi:heat shock protein HslJ
MRRTVRPGDFNITARFADGQISGHSGVNTYGGSCTVGSHWRRVG